MKKTSETYSEAFGFMGFLSALEMRNDGKSKPYKKSPKTKAEKTRRAANKRARQSRRKNR